MRALLLILLVGCASLERDRTAPAPEDAGVVEPATPDAGKPDDVPYPPVDAGVPDAPEQGDGNTCPMPPPVPCTCNEDCASGETCHRGVCLKVCRCDEECSSPHGDFVCHYGVCWAR